MPRREPEEIKAEIADLQRRLQKRRGKPGFAANVKDIEARLAELDAEMVL
jgi:hypothetical protein